MAEIFGTTGNDLLFGTPEDDVIDVLEGNDDVVSALDGDDTVNGGLGDDNVLGAAGDDEINGGEGTDYLVGGEDNDLIDGGAGTDILIGENGNDTLLGGDGNDLMLGDIDDANGIGDDVLRGGGGDDKITGGLGNDRVFGEGDRDILSGGVGDDLVRGGEDNDLVFGAGGDDLVYGDRGDDEVSGGSGNDSVYGGRGADTLDGVTTFFSPQPGIGEIDELTGNRGGDVFLLGQISPSGIPTVFYDDGDTATGGTNDYVEIADFNSDEGDKIQLVGDTNDYLLAASPEGLDPGTAIYFNDGDTPELIAILTDIDPDTVSLDNPEQFQSDVLIPEVSVFAEPDTAISEAEGNAGKFVFKLSAPSPAGGLTINFRAGDDDPFINSRDINFAAEANTNIKDISVIPLRDRTSFITIPEGVTEASFVVVPFVDNFVEPDETISVELIPQDAYTVDGDNKFADLIITEGIPLITGTEKADYLAGTKDAEILSGLAGDDTLEGKAKSDRLVGGVGNDILIGGKGADRLVGVDPLSSQPGIGDIDEFTGSQGNDLFVLGQISSEGTPSIFYDDGDAATAGLEDYAAIADFQAGEDKIELVGEARDYSLGASPAGFNPGTFIFADSGEVSELIAFVADVSSNTLSLEDSSQFIFA